MVYTDPDEVPWSAYLAVAAVLAVVVGAILPWFTDGGQTVSGLDSTYANGQVTAGAAVGALGLLIAYEWGLTAQLGTILAGLVAIGFGLDIWRQVADEAAYDPAVGLYLTVVAGAVLVGVGTYGLAASVGIIGGSDGDGAPDGIAE